MIKKQQLFVYRRKELFLLIFLAGMFSVFAFTLGVHLGKDVSSRIGTNEDTSTHSIASTPDRIPDEEELQESEKPSRTDLNQLLTHELKQEVDETGIHLNSPRQLNLPEEAKSKNAGATTLTTLKTALQHLQQRSP